LPCLVEDISKIVDYFLFHHYPMMCYVSHTNVKVIEFVHLSNIDVNYLKYSCNITDGCNLNISQNIILLLELLLTIFSSSMKESTSEKSTSEQSKFNTFGELFSIFVLKALDACFVKVVLC